MDMTPILEEAAKRLNCAARDLEWFSWPEMFASTAGPHGGIGGQALTTFQVFAFDNGLGDRVKCCAGVWKTWDGQPLSRW